MMGEGRESCLRQISPEQIDSSQGGVRGGGDIRGEGLIRGALSPPPDSKGLQTGRSVPYGGTITRRRRGDAGKTLRPHTLFLLPLLLRSGAIRREDVGRRVEGLMRWGRGRRGCQENLVAHLSRCGFQRQQEKICNL